MPNFKVNSHSMVHRNDSVSLICTHQMKTVDYRGIKVVGFL